MNLALKVYMDDPVDILRFHKLTDSRELLACGMYKLNSNGTKTGSVKIFQVIKDREAIKLKQIHSVDCGAVFDLKWVSNSVIRNYCYRDCEFLLTVVCADGRVNLMYKDKSEESLIVIATPQESSPALSLDLKCDKEGNNLIAVSRGDHSVSLHTIKFGFRKNETEMYMKDDKGETTSTRSFQSAEIVRWKAHEEIAEIWTVSFDPKIPSILYTGGDDGLLKVWNLTTHQLLSTNTAHTAGVTCIVPSSALGMIATGSYDGKLRIFSLNEGKTQTILRSEHNVGNGIWRLEWHPLHENLILASCTDGGARVFSIVNKNGDVKLIDIAQYDEHKSIVYGCDWSSNTVGSDSLLVGTCSFYDKAIHLWTVEKQASYR